MKCVEELSTGKVTRIPDMEAQKKVAREKTHKFVSRTIWREKVRDVGKKSEQ